MLAKTRQADQTIPPIPVRLRPATTTAIGTTAFFRNRPLFQTLLEELAATGLKKCSILFHACSIGAEVYSLLIQYLIGGFNHQFDLQCFAVDKEPGFLAFAAQGVFPGEIEEGMTRAERRYFQPVPEGLKISEELQARTSFLAPCDFNQFQPRRTYTVVVLLNALLYVPSHKQAQALDQIACYNTSFLAVTGFHPDQIKADMERNNYMPIIRNIEAIHESWTDRRVPMPSVPEKREGIYADWRLPPFSHIPDWQYRYCALFRKAAS